MKFEETSEFRKDFKRLSKKYRLLPADLETFRNIVAAKPLGSLNHYHVITSTNRLHVIKARVRSRDLKRQALRVVYAYAEAEQRIDLIELYFKGDKENEDQERIRRYLAARAG